MLGLFAIVLLYFMFCESSYDASPIQTCISTFSIQKITDLVYEIRMLSLRTTGLVYEIRMLSLHIIGLVYEFSYAFFAHLCLSRVHKRDMFSGS